MAPKFMVLRNHEYIAPKLTRSPEEGVEVLHSRKSSRKDVSQLDADLLQLPLFDKFVDTNFVGSASNNPGAKDHENGVARWPCGSIPSITPHHQVVFRNKSDIARKQECGTKNSCPRREVSNAEDKPNVGWALTSNTPPPWHTCIGASRRTAPTVPQELILPLPHHQYAASCQCLHCLKVARSLPMLFNFLGCGAISLSAIVDAASFSLPIKRTTAGIYWNEPAIPEQVYVGANHRPVNNVPDLIRCNRKIIFKLYFHLRPRKRHSAGAKSATLYKVRKCPMMMMMTTVPMRGSSAYTQQSLVLAILL